MVNTDKAKELEKSTGANAKRLLDIINGPDLAQMRDDNKFTLEVLEREISYP